MFFDDSRYDFSASGGMFVKCFLFSHIPISSVRELSLPRAIHRGNQDVPVR